MKRVLIISPYFPPSNAADMQRIRMSLPYFRAFDWDVEVVTVDPKHSEMVKDSLLAETVPEDIPIHVVSAFSKKWTATFGLGSLALRSLLFYLLKVNQLLRKKHFDLIYFSTTQFPICILGAYWKRKFGIPYVIDMQDPWHSDYYRNKPKDERPPKYWFSYRLNKYLEPLAMKQVGGLISVSENYITTLKQRYPISNIPAAVITFGAFEKDFELAKKHNINLPVHFKEDKIAFLYIGVVGPIMKKALGILFQTLQQIKNREEPLYNRLQFYFIGTSYAPKGQAIPTVLPVAEKYNVQECVTEQTDRVGYYQTIKAILKADGLIMPGSDDPQYTASKLYPYILAEKPLLGIVHPQSSMVRIVEECNAGAIVTLDEHAESAYLKVKAYLEGVIKGMKPQTNWGAFEKYTAREMTRRQCELFNEVLITRKTSQND